MAGFRVQEHHKWRKQTAAPASEAPRPSRPQPARPPTAEPLPADAHVDQIDQRVRSLGPLAWPAVAYDSIFGGWRNQNAPFFIVRFVLVVAAVALFIGGVSGEAPLVYKTGEYRNVTPASVIDAYVTETSITAYKLQVDRSPSGQVRAAFDGEKGDLRVPDLEQKDSSYALQVRLVRKDPSITPVLLLSTPEDSHRKVTPASDDTVSMKFPPILLDQAGEWELVVHSSRGIGDVDMHLAVAEAPIVAAEGPSSAWLQILIGLAILIVLVGAYTPGALLLRERRELDDPRTEEEQWYGHSAHAPTNKRGKVPPRLVPKHGGVKTWNNPGKEAPDRLAKLPGRGWIIRLD